MIAVLLAELDRFTSCEYDDDITLLTLTRTTIPQTAADIPGDGSTRW